MVGDDGWSRWLETMVGVDSLSWWFGLLAVVFLVWLLTLASELFYEGGLRLDLVFGLD